MNISTAVKNAYKDGSHAKILTVSFPDINYTVPQNEVYYESMTLDEAIFDSDSFEAVGCIASQFVVSIRNSGYDLKNQKVVVTISLEGVTDSDIPLFYGYVDSVDKEAQKKLQKITAYDALYSKGSIDVASWYNGLSFPITLKNLRDSLFPYIGIQQTSVTLPADSLLIHKEYNPNTLPALDVIKAICQLNGCFGIMNRTGVFEYRYVNVGTTPEVVSFYRKMDYKDYTITPVGKLTIRQNKDDTGVSVGSGSNVYIIQGNMFTYNISASTLFSLAGTVYSHLNDVSYIPFEASNNGYPWIEVGDNCVLEYSVYDFEQSTPSQSIYSDVQVVVFKRTMKGIQNLIDDCSAEGKELQQVFISDVSRELEILQQTVNNLVKNMSTEITTYRNTSTINISSGKTATIADLVYQASQGNIVIFHEEADLEIEADESLKNGVYTENDVVGTVRYYVNGYKLQNHISTGVLTEGKHILNLMQFWEAGQQDTNRVQAKLTVTNGSVKIRKFRAQAYVTVKQSEYRNGAIEVTKMPNKTVYNPGDSLDFTGLVISKVYFDESIPSENVTAHCTFSPAEGSEVTSIDMIDVQVTYIETTELGEHITYNTSFQLSTQYLIGISVEQEPNKMEYYVGDMIDLTGISVVADYSDGTTKNVTEECSYSPGNGHAFESEGTNAVNISYTEDGITCTTSLSIYVMPLEEKPIYILDHDEPDNLDKRTNYEDITADYDLVKGRLFINAAYSHSHNDVKYVTVSDSSGNVGLIRENHFGPTTANFSIKASGAMVVNYNSPVATADSSRVSWKRLRRAVNNAQLYESRLHDYMNSYFLASDLYCPEYYVEDSNTLVFGRYDTEPSPRLRFDQPLAVKFEMSPLSICGPLDTTKSFDLYAYGESGADNTKIPLKSAGFVDGKYTVHTVIPEDTIVGPSEFNGDVFAVHPGPNVGHLYIVSGPHAGQIARHTSATGFSDFFDSHYNKGGISVTLETISSAQEDCTAFVIEAIYWYPVSVTTTTYSYHFDEFHRFHVSIDSVETHTGYMKTNSRIEVPFTDLLYVGRESDAPEWAKVATEDDV